MQRNPVNDEMNIIKSIFKNSLLIESERYSNKRRTILTEEPSGDEDEPKEEPTPSSGSSRPGPGSRATGRSEGADPDGGAGGFDKQGEREKQEAESRAQREAAEQKERAARDARNKQNQKDTAEKNKNRGLGPNPTQGAKKRKDAEKKNNPVVPERDGHAGAVGPGGKPVKPQEPKPEEPKPGEPKPVAEMYYNRLKQTLSEGIKGVKGRFADYDRSNRNLNSKKEENPENPQRKLPAEVRQLYGNIHAPVQTMMRAAQELGVELSFEDAHNPASPMHRQVADAHPEAAAASQMIASSMTAQPGTVKGLQNREFGFQTK